jgi:glycosyltransferase involved in cell wall biosynthesis
MPLVSIIIPCHNAEPWLEATLLSALGQTWDPKEIIVVDDGSTDGSAAVARRFEARGVRVVVQANRGASAARNHGLRMAGGDFVQFLDADDLLSADKIAAQMETLQSGPRDAVASCRWGRFFDDPGTARFCDQAVFRDFAPAREFLIHQAETSDMIHPAAWLTPRAVAADAGPWDETLSLNDDGEYFCRILLRASAVRFSPRGSAYYRSALPGSLSRLRSPAAMASLHNSIALFEGHLRSGDDSPRVRQAMANLWRQVQFELYPDAPGLSDDAGRRSRALGRATNRLPFGPRFRIAARVLGWKAARRLQRRFSGS